MLNNFIAFKNLWGNKSYVEALNYTSAYMLSILNDIDRDEEIPITHDAALRWGLHVIKTIHNDNNWLGEEIIKSDNSPLEGYYSEIVKLWGMLAEIKDYISDR